MGTDKTRAEGHPGFLIPDSRMELWAAESSYTQAGPTAGVPEPLSRSSMALHATGDQDAGTTTQIQTHRGGHPLMESGLESTVGRVQDFGATFIQRATTSADWQGHDAPRNVTKFEFVQWIDGSLDLKWTKEPHAIALDDGTVLCAVEIRDDALANPYGVSVYRRVWSTGAWTRVDVTGQTTAPSQVPCPCLLVLPSGRVMLLHLVDDTIAGVSLIRGWYSDDDGVTWSYAGEGLVRERINVTVQRLRCAARDGQVLLVATTATELWQFASADLGQTFAKVDQWNPTQDPGHCDVHVVPNGFLLTYTGGTTADRGECKLLGSAFSLVSEGTAIDIGSVGDSLATCVDDAGSVFAYFRLTATTNQVKPLVSFDQGENWSGFGIGDQFMIDFSAAIATVYPTNLSCVAVRDRILLFCNHASPTSTLDNSLSCFYLGGYGAITMPKAYRQIGQTGTAGFTRHWFPFEIPSNMGATYTTTGAGTFTLHSSGYGLITTTANTLYETYVPTSTIAQGLLVSVDWNALTGGSATTENRVIELRNADGTESYSIQVRVSGTQWGVYDMNAGPAQVGTTQSLTGRGEFLISLTEGKCTVRGWSVAANGSRTTTTGITSTTLVDGGASTMRVRIGHVQNVTATTAIYHFQIGEGDAVGQQLLPSNSYPTDLQGRLYASAFGRPIYTSNGVSIKATGGPTIRGERWSIATRYTYEIRRMLDLPSPRQTHRTTSTAAQSYAFRFDQSLDLASYGPRSLLGIYVGNANWPQFEIFGITAAGADISLGTANLCQGLDGIHYAQAGGAVRPHASTTGPGLMLRHQEFQGATFRLDNTYSYRMTSQSEGRFGPAGTRLRPTIILDAPAALATTSGTGGAIIPRSALVLVDIGTAYAGIKISVPTPSSTIPRPAESYYECGVLKLGWVQQVGSVNDWSRTTDLEDATEMVESRDKVAKTRTPAPPRRTINVSWMDGIDQTAMDRDADPDWTYASSDSSEANGSIEGTAYLLEGMYRDRDGSAKDLVYIAKIPMGSGVRVLNRRVDFLHARMMGPPDIEVVLGEENTTELVRVAEIPLQEIV